MERHPWFTRAWTRPSVTGRRAVLAAVGYLVAGTGFLVLAILKNGVGALVALVAAGCWLWLGTTLVATIVWRRAHPTQS